MASLFLSHGAPDIVISERETAKFLKRLPDMVSRPDAIVVMSAHFETDGPTVVADPAPGTLHDFGGFSDELYHLAYPAPGHPQLARRIVKLAGEAGLNMTVLDKRPFDHGVWTPLMLAWPAANIPVVQISVDPNRDAAYHHAIGRALSDLQDDNVLLIGSGHITHNLRAVFSVLRGSGPADPAMASKVEAFTGWFADRLGEGDLASILAWAEKAPHVADNHPTHEHLMPLFFALGAAGDHPGARRVHESIEMGFFAQDCWLFEPVPAQVTA